MYIIVGYLFKRESQIAREKRHSRRRPGSAAVADDRATPQWRPRLARGRMQASQAPREPAARCHPPAARHADLETRSGAEMPILPHPDDERGGLVGGARTRHFVRRW